MHHATLLWKVKSATKKITVVLGVEFTAVMIICAILLRVRYNKSNYSLIRYFKAKEKNIKEEHMTNGWTFLKILCEKG